MSLKSTDRNERVYYFSEKPSDSEYPNKESFYFRIVGYEIDDKSNVIQFVIIRILSFYLGDNLGEKDFKFSSPYIPLSLENAVRASEKLK